MRLAAFGMILIAVRGSAAPAELPLMPLPANVTRADGALAIDGAFHVGVCGAHHPNFDQAVSRFIHELASETGLILPAAVAPSDCLHATLSIEFQQLISLPQLGDDESYTLSVTAAAARLRAPTSLGIVRGLATFRQLVQVGTRSYVVPAITIDDRPRFPWRGFMLDVSRH